MIRNYILAALRNMRRYRVFTIINITGLAIGLSICMVIIMSVANQMKSDKYNTKADRIYRVVTNRQNDTNVFAGYATVSLPLAGALNDFTGVRQTLRIRNGFGRHWIGTPDQQHIPLSGMFADPAFFEFFEYPMFRGDAGTALIEPYSVVLTKKAAKKLFGTEDAMGEVIDMDHLGSYTVTGIVDMENVSTHVEFEAIASMASAVTLEKDSVIGADLENWEVTTSGWVYMELTDHNVVSDVENYVDQQRDEHLAAENQIVFNLQSLTGIKPGPLMGNEIGPFMPWIIVYILGGLGLLIMASSCFNYINLSVARSMSRSKEVGIRKVNGAARKHIIGQFLVESVLLALFSFCLALVLLIYLEPSFEQLNFARILKWDLSHEPIAWAAILCFTVLTGLVAGIFPSLIMSNFQPLRVIKGINNMKLFSHVGMRKVLIVVQFSLSLFFIISILLLYSQVKMMMEAETGFQAENNILVPYDEETYETLRTSLSQQSWVENISRASHVPVTGITHGDGLGRTLDKAGESISYYSVDENYLENMQIQLVAGRMLSSVRDGEPEREVVINEKALLHYGFETPESALGEVLYSADSAKVSVVGVMPDYHHEVMMMSVKPLVWRYKPDQFRYMQVRVTEGNLEQAEREVARILETIKPESVAQVRTMKEVMMEFYDMIFGDLISILIVFAVIATIVSCLGLLGIVIYTTELRLKEVSIRKVLGAENKQLIYTLSWGFVKLVLIATAIAIPLSYVANGFWLNSMAYRISMSPWYYIGGALLLLGVALVTIGSQTLRSLRVNPAETLRSE